CMSWLNSSAFLIALSTYSAPSTSRRVFRPLSNSSLFIPVSSVVPVSVGRRRRPSRDSSPAAEARPPTPESGHRSPLALPVAGALRLVVELAQSGDRQLVDEVDGLGRLYRALGLAHQGDQLLGADARAGPQHDAGLDRLAPLRVGHP